MAHGIERMYERVPCNLTEYGDIDCFSSRPTLVRIGRSGSGHLGTLVRPAARYFLFYTICLYSVPPRTLSFLLLCIRIISFY